MDDCWCIIWIILIIQDHARAGNTLHLSIAGFSCSDILITSPRFAT
jgi:hypothetical protein